MMKEERENKKASPIEINKEYVYIPPKNKKQLGIIRFIKRIFNQKKEDTKSSNIIYTVPKESKKEKMPNYESHIYMDSSQKEESRKISDEYANIIIYAKEIRKDKERHKTLQNKYTEALKTNNRQKVEEIKNKLWESQSNINMAESFLRNKIKELKKSTINIEETTKLINYICGLAKMKMKEKPQHLKNEIEEILIDPVEELNQRKEKIINSKHFTITQKKNMIREIDDELIELTKQEEVKNKTK